MFWWYCEFGHLRGNTAGRHAAEPAHNVLGTYFLGTLLGKQRTVYWWLDNSVTVILALVRFGIFSKQSSSLVVVLPYIHDTDYKPQQEYKLRGTSFTPKVHMTIVLHQQTKAGVITMMGLRKRCDKVKTRVLLLWFPLLHVRIKYLITTACLANHNIHWFFLSMSRSKLTAKTRFFLHHLQFRWLWIYHPHPGFLW